jgi:PAS domain S-box-containing protein
MASIQRNEGTLAQYRAVLASTLDPLVTIDAWGTIQAASNSVERVFGWTPEELVGQNIRVLMPEPHHSRHDGYLEHYRQTGDTNILGRTREFEGVRRDGSSFPIELSVARADVPGELPLFTGIIRDITERKRAEADIAFLRNMAVALASATDTSAALRIALETIGAKAGWPAAEAWMRSDDGERLELACRWSADGAAPGRTDAPARVETLARGEGLPGRVWAAHQRVWIADSRNDSAGARRASAPTTDVRFAVGIPISTDDVFGVLVFRTRSHVPEDDRIVELAGAALATLGPVIERKRVEDELARHHARLEELVSQRTVELEKSHARLRQADRLASLGTLAAGLGHDMNNVLLPVRARLDVIERKSLPADITPHIASIRSSVEYLQGLAEGLHLLARDPDDPGRSGDFTDPAAWWKHVEPLIARALPRHVRFETRVKPGVPLAAVAAHRLTQAVLNLVVNAGEAVGEDGRVTLTLDSADEGRSLRVEVADNGEGMTEDVRRRAIDPFFTTKKRGLGTGLGLSLVHGVVSAAGGELDIESAPGAGTTVRLTLPATARSAAMAVGSAPIAALVTVADPRIGALVAAMLTSQRAAVRAVPPGAPDARPRPHERVWITDSSAEALELARDGAKPPRVILLGGDERGVDPGDGVFVLSHPDDFEALRRAVTQAIHASQECRTS